MNDEKATVGCTTQYLKESVLSIKAVSEETGCSTETVALCLVAIQLDTIGEVLADGVIRMD